MSASVDEILWPLLEKLSPIAVLAGSGISIDPPTCLPSGQLFIDSLIRQVAPNERTASHLRSLMAMADREDGPPRLRFESLLETIANLWDPDLDILDYLDTSRGPNRFHRAIASLLTRHVPVLTTNFDTGIEHACREVELHCCVHDADFLEAFQHFANGTNDRQHLLVKLHGCITDRASLRATLRQIGRAGYCLDRDESKRDLISAIVSRCSLVIIGYSGMDDYDVMPMLRRLANQVMWIQHDPDHDFRLDDTREDVSLIPQRLRALAGKSRVLYVARGRSWDALASISRYFGDPSTEAPPEPSDRSPLDFELFLSRWAAAHGLTEERRSRLLCATLLVAAEENPWAEQVLVEWPSQENGSAFADAARENLLGSIARDRCDYDAARSHFSKAAELFATIGDLQDFGNNLTNLGHVSRSLKLNDDARRYYLLGLRAKRRSPSRRGIGTSAFGLAALAHDAGNEAKWRHYLRMANTAATKEGDLTTEALTECFLARESLGNPRTGADAAVVLRRWHEAIGQMSSSPARAASEIFQADVETRKTDKETLSLILEHRFQPDPEYGGMLTLPAVSVSDRERLQQTIVHYERAAKLYERAGDFSDYYQAKFFSAAAYQLLEDWPGFKASIGACMTAADRIDDFRLSAAALYKLTAALDPPLFRDLPDFADVTEVVLAALNQVPSAALKAAKDETTLSLCAAAYYRASLMVFTAAPKEAVAFARTAIALYRQLKEPVWQGHATARLGRIHAEHDRYSRALRCYRRALRLFESHQPRSVREIQAAIALCLRMQSR